MRPDPTHSASAPRLRGFGCPLCGSTWTSLDVAVPRCHGTTAEPHLPAKMVTLTGRPDLVEKTPGLILSWE